ncbi:MAG: RNA-binding protein [Bacteroidota bacterium]
MTVSITNIDSSVSADELKSLLEEYGSIDQLELHEPLLDGSRRAWITCDEITGTTIVKHLQGDILRGRIIKAELLHAAP